MEHRFGRKKSPPPAKISIMGFSSKSKYRCKDDTLPCKRQALAWQKEPNTWPQALQRYKQFFNQLGV